MPDAPPTHEPWPLPAVDNPKQRRCLRCKAAFASQWSGERICRRCKGSDAWRMGRPLTTHPGGGGR